MAIDFSKPLLTDTYSSIVPAIQVTHSDLARWLEPTLTGTHTNVPTGAIRNNAATATLERYSGTAWAALQFKVGAGTADTGAFTTLSASSNLSSGTRVDAPIYYDSNNTGYYVDPASTSVVNNFNINGVASANFYSWPSANYGLGNILNNTLETSATIGAGHILGDAATVDLLAFRGPSLSESLSGTTWTTIANSNEAFNGRNGLRWGSNYTQTLASGTAGGFRFTFSGFGYCFWDYLLISGTSSGNAYSVTLETSTNGTTWTTQANNVAVGTDWPGYHYLRNQSNNSTTAPYLRITILYTSNGNGISIGNISLFGNYGSYTPLFTWDYSRNITFGNNTYVPGNMYDNANTAYYVKPSGTSVFNIINGNKATITPGTSGVSTGLNVVNGDITTYRAGGTTGVIYLSNTGSNYLYWDGANYYLGGSVALHAGNYSSYALPLAGGTLTGSIVVPTTDRAFETNISGGVSLYSNEINAGALGGTGNLYLGFRRTTQVYIRGSNIVLGADNYSSYAMPISASATNSVDLRAPIFYDSNNTAYYADPASTSSFNAITSVSESTGSINTNWIYHNDIDRNAAGATYYPNVNTRAATFRFVNASSVGTGGNYAGMLHFSPWTGTTASTGDAAYQLVFGSTATNGGGNPQLVIRNGIDTTWNAWRYIPMYGLNQYTSTFYATTYYDSDNTGYYCDPASTGNFNALTLAGTLTLNASGNAIVMNGSGSTNIQMNAGGVLRGYMYSDSSGVGILTSAGGWAIQVPYGQTYTNVTSSVRAPLFYDTDNTGYYCDPASTTNLNSAYFAGYNVTNATYGTMGDYATNGTTSKCIWSIGTSWPLANMYGIGYEYNTQFADHIIAIRENGTSYTWLAMGGGIKTTGSITAYASDARLKTNIRRIENALQKVLRLDGVEYDWVDGIEDLGFKPSYKHESGVLAQQIQKEMPDAVDIAPFNAIATERTGTDMQYLTVDKEKLIALLIEAIKEQQTQIDELRNLINA